jgi:hypothetical protein
MPPDLHGTQRHFDYGLADWQKLLTFCHVNTAEIKMRIDQMTDDERFFAAAYLQHLAQERDPVYRAMLSERMKRMDDGKKVSLDQAHRLHQALEAEGL